MIFAPSSSNGYAGAYFSGIYDLILAVDKGVSDWEAVKEHISHVVFFINSAADILKPDLHNRPNKPS